MLSIFKPTRRARITSFRATSTPLRSSLGSGSVKPASFALRTSELHFPPAPCVRAKLLNRKLIVPDNTPSILVISSPVATRSLRVEMIGRPAPTEDSW